MPRDGSSRSAWRSITLIAVILLGGQGAAQTPTIPLPTSLETTISNPSSPSSTGTGSTTINPSSQHTSSTTTGQTSTHHSSALSQITLSHTSSSTTSPTNSTAIPRHSDDAPSGSQQTNNSRGLVSYYFVFLGLVLAVTAASLYIWWRRRRLAMSVRRGDGSRAQALQRDLLAGGGDRDQRRARYGWDVAAGEEGLDENGEAPPPYVPKRASHEQGEEMRRRREEEDGRMPAVPLRTLSRDALGHKPPDYVQTIVEEDTGSIASPTRSHRPSNASGMGSSSRTTPASRDGDSGDGPPGI